MSGESNKLPQTSHGKQRLRKGMQEAPAARKKIENRGLTFTLCCDKIQNNKNIRINSLDGNK